MKLNFCCPDLIRLAASLILSIFLFCSFGPYVFEQSTKAQQSNSRTATLLVDTDDACHFFIDDEDKGELTADVSHKFTVSIGDHILKCKNDSIPDLVWRKVVEVKDMSQVAAVVSLKSLHIQCDQAVAKAQNRLLQLQRS